MRSRSATEGCCSTRFVWSGILAWMAIGLCLAPVASSFAFDDPPAAAGDVPPAVPEAGEATSPEAPATPVEPAAPPANDAPRDVVTDATGKVLEIAQEVDQNPQAQEVSAGILQPIYQLAEAMAFPAFHWLAFAMMATGVVSYALQIALGKLAVLLRGSISFKEILSDGLGLIISLIGLVLTTQAAAENSTFTTSAAAVLSASAVGVVAGFIFYVWGQSQELEAVRGRKQIK